MTLQQLYSLFLLHPAVSTDSRNCPQGCIFFALRGDSFDGNNYIADALDRGAAIAVGDRPDLKSSDRVVKVENSLETLQQLAALHRRTLGLPVIAITGTNGKTTTKELTAAVLSARFCTHRTQGNFNNHIGAPLTLLQLTRQHEMAVVEIGANHPGEIATLCQIVQPDYGLITNIGRAHLEGFGSFEGVVRTKTELYDYIEKYGKNVFANADNPILSPFLQKLNAITYGKAAENFVSGKIISSSPFLNVEWKRKSENETFHIATKLVGDYNCENVFAAICIASFFGVAPDAVSRAISNYIPTNNRSQAVRTSRNSLIVDAYNANPDSMRAALDNFFASVETGNALILGEMRELGDYSRDAHQELVDRIRQAKPDFVALCGNAFASCQNIPSEWHLFTTTELLTDFLQREPLNDCTILIKGSHANRLETVVPFL
jgi:UDP-N-acetylmuramoyl-tripeptide--D-alanyl-D-alanine ligase